MKYNLRQDMQFKCYLNISNNNVATAVEQKYLDYP